MEAPSSWGAAEHIADSVVRQWEDEQAAPATVLLGSPGASLPKRVCDALRRAGLLEDPEMTSWDTGAGGYELGSLMNLAGSRSAAAERKALLDAYRLGRAHEEAGREG